MPATIPAHIRRLSDGAVLVVFATLLGLVVWGSLFRPLPNFDENRLRNPPPSGDPAAFPKEFDRYFADRVGFRDRLVRWHNATLVDGFGEENWKAVWMGSDSWLYLNVADPYEYCDDQPTLAQRYDAWADELAARGEYLNGRGMEYVVLLGPEKSSVYPEHMPVSVRQHPPPEPLGAMAERLTARGVRVVNPLPAISDAKAKYDRPLYYQQDTHWTPTGARVAYRELAAEVRKTHPDWSPLEDDQYPLGEDPGKTDLKRLFRISLGPPPPVTDYLRPRQTTRDSDPPFGPLLPEPCRRSSFSPSVWTCDAATGPPLLMFCDSFGGHLIPYLSAEFCRVGVVLSDSLEPAAVDAEKPVMVIQVLVGRKFYTTTPAERRYH